MFDESRGGPPPPLKRGSTSRDNFYGFRVATYDEKEKDCFSFVGFFSSILVTSLMCHLSHSVVFYKIKARDLAVSSHMVALDKVLFFVRTAY